MPHPLNGWQSWTRLESSGELQSEAGRRKMSQKIYTLALL